MKVIGAGCPRTGTLSTHAALTRLGLPCYHMAEVALHEDHTRAWYSFLIERKPMDWKALFLRDPESWYEGYMALHGAMQDLAPHRAANPRLDRWLQVFLGCEVPDQPFPHLNEGADTVKAGLSFIFGIA